MVRTVDEIMADLLSSPTKQDREPVTAHSGGAEDGTPPSGIPRINPAEPDIEMEDSTEEMVVDSDVITADSQEENVQFSCNDCNVVFSTNGVLNIHRNTAHMEIWYTCNFCDYKDSTQGGLTRHMQGIHMGVMYWCDQCEFKAYIESCLVEHKETKHMGLKYSCDQCEYKATKKIRLTEHQIVNRHKQTSSHMGVRYN